MTDDVQGGADKRLIVWRMRADRYTPARTARAGGPHRASGLPRFQFSHSTRHRPIPPLRPTRPTPHALTAATSRRPKSIPIPHTTRLAGESYIYFFPIRRYRK
ncbi:hypothetical protein EVAR_29071_1 [Eumeta japonica]|uniref:Uncharacterized protein n=1 Tax=Eumeta variegata TaxID=151549 RepID=A0A4C1VMH1_EUMVA|nr:hypothetical protein EVAR_29071_1 [Eumeta japonica]